MQDLGTLGGDQSWALGVSADGSVVVGISGGRAFRWTAARGMQDLGTLGGRWSDARGVSADGSVVVGWAWNAKGQVHAFRWTAARGMQDLGTLGGDWSEANGVSADGSVVVGVGLRNAAGQHRAFRWTAAGGMQNLGTLGGEWVAEARGVSADGSVVVGYAHNATGLWRAFRWTTAGGMEDLNITYTHLLTNGSMFGAHSPSLPTGAILRGGATTLPQGASKPSCWTLEGPALRSGLPGWARWAAIGARLMAFPPMAPWWSARLRTPQGMSVPFAGRRRVGCRTSVRSAAVRVALLVFPPMVLWWSVGITAALRA
jgi:probable HAF family extracellular repeat protein